MAGAHILLMSELNPEISTHPSSIVENAADGRPTDADDNRRLAQLGAVYGKLPLGLLVLDRQLRVVLTNERLADTVGVRAVPLGEPLQLVLPHVAGALMPAVQSALETARPIDEVTFSAARPDQPQTICHWSAMIVAMSDSPLMSAGVAILIRESTERIRARESEAEHALHREGIYVLTSALVEATTAEEVVRATVRQATVALEAAGAVIARCTPDRRHIELLDAEGMPPDLAAEWRRFPTTAPVPLAYVARTGESLFLESAADWELHFPLLAALAKDVGHPANAVVPLVVDGTPVGALGVAFASPRRFDAEERVLIETIGRQCALALERRRLLESERAAREAAVTANALKTKFVAMMSHELRTPLQAIVGYADALQMEIHGPLSEGQRNAVARMNHNLEHLLQLVGGVLSLTRAEAGQIHYALTDVSVEQVLRFVAEATAPQVAVKRLRTDYQGARDLLVRADGEKLRQIVLNVFSNAVKFTPEGGEITTVCSTDGTVVRIEVRDTGRGIAPDQLERVFEPFVQVGPPLTKGSDGSGLGLAISREFARGMGGDLTVTSELGVGSTFILVLPAAEVSG
jgi:signal transduction histidine kinase